MGNKDVKHVSIDLYGEDGALPLDLSIPFPERFYNAFEIVTNGGTSEHVDNQFECWRNIHKCLKLNGFLLSTSPEKYKYNKDHCDWFCDVNFFEVFAQRLGYKIYFLGRVLFPHNG